MNILLVYPKYPDTFWSFKYALKFISKKAVNPPLGLLTISSMLPQEWKKQLIDLNIESLRDTDIKWADYVFISAMNVQVSSTREVIRQCKAQNVKIVGGGPLFTEEPAAFPEVDHLVLNEAELTLPGFLKDLEKGCLRPEYSSENFADLKQSPIPDYSLVKIRNYNTMNLQLTRGCPFDCEFCDITALFGKKVRMKNTMQIIHELEAILKMGWHGSVFFVDDNFIGNKRMLKKELLPALTEWMKKTNYPFSFLTEASINLSDDEELMQMMKEAGFSSVFVGIETMELASLKECGKIQNTGRDMIKSVHKIQQYGIEVTGGFILGFDNDTHGVFQQQIDFIRESGIISAMVGLLNAPKKTLLYKRLAGEGRIIRESTGDNTDFSLNFIPKMDKTILLDGYARVINNIYGGKAYYDRVKTFIKRFSPNSNRKPVITFNLIRAFFRSLFKLGIVDKHRVEYWKLILWTFFKRPGLVPLAVTYAVYGYHFRKVFNHVL